MTIARITRVRRPPATSTVPALQTPVALLYVPWLGVSDTKVRPAGS